MNLCKEVPLVRCVAGRAPDLQSRGAYHVMEQEKQFQRFNHMKEMGFSTLFFLMFPGSLMQESPANEF
ncbi:hypothetical protein HNY73_003297 [Argiope bruennichi]|uniref:Uncharacterized protein n=1 Tax=Argiope bruennichi TaxID=94029 RepID=A0A8T0FXH6_ARGBR|nr:hypothetical protein HNY73_003297 [Argiope bruennichi]